MQKNDSLGQVCFVTDSTLGIVCVEKVKVQGDRMYTILYFSPTGNARYIAQQLAQSLSSRVKTFPLEHIDPLQLKKDDHLIIVYAIHAFNAPRTVKRFIKNLPSDQFKQVSLIGVGCNTGWVNGAVSKEIREVLVRKKYTVCVDEVIAMPLTFMMSFPEEVIQGQLMTAAESIEKISEDIKTLHVSQRPIAFKSNLVNFVGRVEPLASRFFGLELHAKKSCTQCGLCVRECPEQNIRMTEKGKIRFGFKCMMCMRCIYHCPVQAITPRISKFIPISKGYSVEKYVKRDDVQ